MKHLIKLLAVVFICASAFFVFSVASSAPAVYTWTEQTGSGSKAWKQFSITPDAQKIFAVEFTGADTTLRMSLDGGVSWDPINAAGTKKWNGIASSANGSKLVAIVDGGFIYTSTDAGDTWTERASINTWSSITSSSDGVYLAATTFGGNIYTSDDSGETWTPRDSLRQWTTITSSPDGSRLAAATYAGGGEPIYTSTDYGVTWTPQINSNSGCWGYLTSYNDGVGIVAGNCTPGPVITSTDGGSTWNTTTSGDGAWYSVGSSADGSVLAAAGHNGLLTISTDGGATWETQTDLGNKAWTYVAVSADGTKFVASAGGSNIYTASFVEPVVINVPNLELEYPTDISTTTVTLNAIIKNDGGTSTIMTGFNWGADTNYGSTASTSQVIITGDPFSENISGLTCGTLYHYQAFAVNSAGTGTSPDFSFTTGDCLTGATTTPPMGTTTPPVATSTPPVATSTPTNTTSTQTIIYTSNGGGSVSSGSRLIFPQATLVAGQPNSCVTLIASLRPTSTGSEVMKLQELLNKFMDAKLTVSGIYDAATIEAVKAFQLKYSDEILAPWGVTEPSGIVSFLSLKKLNELSCGVAFSLSSVEQYLIDQYRLNPQSTTTPSFIPTGTTTPIEVGTDTLTPQEAQTAGAANTPVSNSIFKKISNFFKNIF